MTLCALIRLGGALALLTVSAAIAPTPAPAQVTQRAPAAVADPSSADPPGGAPRGTIIMVHAGGWAGHDAHAQGLLSKDPGNLFLARGWRVVSLDYNEGTDGLQDVLNAAGGELARKSGDGPLCLYGESSGAHLALVAAARLRAIDCVIGLGTPTDLPLYQSEGSVSADFRVRLVASQISRFFGRTAAESAPWNPVSLAPSMNADVLLVHEADDAIVPAVHSTRFQAVRPTTQTVELERGDPDDPSTRFVHGTISAAGRDLYAAAVGSFADRAVAAHQAERSATHTGCERVRSSLTQTGLSRLRDALRCLALKDAPTPRTASGASAWQRTSVKMHGEVSAARVWASLRATASGRHALAATARRRAKITVTTGDRSRVVLRASR